MKGEGGKKGGRRGSSPCSTHLGQVSGLPHSVDPTEGDDVRLALLPGLHHVPQDVHTTLGTQDLDQGLLHTGTDQGLDT